VTVLLCFLAVSFLYFLIAVYISSGIHNRHARRHDLPKVSVVIPARDEEDNIVALLDSLLEADYPAKLLQIILVNDLSQDRTRELALQYVERFRCEYLVVDVPEDVDRHLMGKIRPLSYGIDKATGEVILMTDADCVVPRGWVKAMVSFFAPGVGMVCGTTLPDPRRQASSLLHSFETLDWAFLLGACVGQSGRGDAQALIGNNFSIARKAYDEIGTFRALTDTFIEDLSLMIHVKRTGHWRVVFPGDAGLLVYTKPLRKLTDVISQRFRWTTGAKTVEWRGGSALGFGALTHVTWPIWALLLGPWFLIPYGLIVLGDVFVVAKMLKRYSDPRLLWLMPFYPVYTLFYGASLLAMKVFRVRVRWKNRKY
jgi:cellulose synthase/poly-beta-1,6-N-acetylglucosamine synthase-like glycosyltransferase